MLRKHMTPGTIVTHKTAENRLLTRLFRIIGTGHYDGETTIIDTSISDTHPAGTRFNAYDMNQYRSRDKQELPILQEIESITTDGTATVTSTSLYVTPSGRNFEECNPEELFSRIIRRHKQRTADHINTLDTRSGRWAPCLVANLKTLITVWAVDHYISPEDLIIPEPVTPLHPIDINSYDQDAECEGTITGKRYTVKLENLLPDVHRIHWSRIQNDTISRNLEHFQANALTTMNTWALNATGNKTAFKPNYNNKEITMTWETLSKLLTDATPALISSVVDYAAILTEETVLVNKGK